MDLIRTTGQYESLSADEVISTIKRLCDRIDARFPGSGLYNVSGRLLEIATQARERAAWISRPLIWARVTTVTMIVLLILSPILAVITYAPSEEHVNISEFLQGLDAGVNGVFLFGAATVFMVTLEVRLKRRRALAAIHELRSVAHIIDMHQLAKDPEHLRLTGIQTDITPVEPMTRADLGQYLDYCSEMLSLTGKVAALYVQGFTDGVAIASVNEVEQLCTSMSRKIWQKIIVLPAE